MLLKKEVELCRLQADIRDQVRGGELCRLQADFMDQVSGGGERGVDGTALMEH